MKEFRLKFKLQKPEKYEIGWDIHFDWPDLSITFPLKPYGTSMCLATSGLQMLNSHDGMWEFLTGGVA